MRRSKPTKSRPAARAATATAETLERRALLAIDTVVAQTYLDSNTDLMVQSAAGSSDGAGTSVVVYSDRDSTTTLGNEVYVRRFDEGSQPIAGADAVNVTTSGAQMTPDVSMNASRQFVVVWQSKSQDGSGWGIYARAYDASGAPVTGDVLVNGTTNGNQVTARVAVGADGKFVVAWVNADTGNGEVYARRFNADGTALGNEFKVSGATTDGYSAPDVAILPSGAFAIAWVRTLRSGNNSADVQVQMYDSTGAAVGSTFLANTQTASDQAEASIASTGNRYVIAWSDNAGGATSIYFRAFDAAGTALTDAQQASQDSNGNRSRPKVAGDANGNFEIGWTRQESGAFYSGNDFRSYDSTFTPTSNETTISDGSSARTLFDLVQSGRGTFRDVSTIGEFVGYGIPVTTSARNAIALAGTGGKDEIIAYDLSSTMVRGQVNGAKQDFIRSAFAGIVVTLGAGADTYLGTDTIENVTVSGGAGNDTIKAGGGDDTIDAGDEADVVYGGAGKDTIDGGVGNDKLYGEAGNDSIIGGDGDDTIDAGDGEDYAIGNGGNDVMYGGAGGDVMTSGAGKNTLYGGDGDDRLNGSNGRDWLNGENGNDRLYGNGGDDAIDGGGGTDKAYGGDGNDYLVGGSSNDRLYGQAGNDTLGGGKGNDYLDGDVGTDTVLGKEPGDILISIEHS